MSKLDKSKHPLLKMLSMKTSNFTGKHFWNLEQNKGWPQLKTL